MRRWALSRAFVRIPITPALLHMAVKLLERYVPPSKEETDVVVALGNLQTWIESKGRADPIASRIGRASRSGKNANKSQ
jgi:hypothetical protein